VEDTLVTDQSEARSYSLGDRAPDATDIEYSVHANKLVVGVLIVIEEHIEKSAVRVTRCVRDPFQMTIPDFDSGGCRRLFVMEALVQERCLDYRSDENVLAMSLSGLSKDLHMEAMHMTSGETATFLLSFDAFVMVTEVKAVRAGIRLALVQHVPRLASAALAAAKQCPE
jgi:hypothetical protein